MPQLRKDPIIDRWVIIASERGKRPSDFKVEHEDIQSGPCFFCAGNESMTPPEVMAYRQTSTKPDTAGWQLRVVPNKFPALKPDSHPINQQDALFKIIGGLGSHEVIIESPRHCMNFTDLNDDEAANLFLSYRDRINFYKEDKTYHYIMIFKNQGRRAGSSLQHAHSQLLALPILPSLIHEEVEKSRHYYQKHQNCIYCDLIARELSEKERIVKSTESYVAISPLAPRFPFETWILPRHHGAHYELTTTDELTKLAGFVKEIIGTLNNLFPNFPYNLMLHTAPLHLSETETYHWHIEIIPRLTKMAGFEHGTGIYINPTSPEIATECIRQALLT